MSKPYDIKWFAYMDRWEAIISSSGFLSGFHFGMASVYKMYEDKKNANKHMELEAKFSRIHNFAKIRHDIAMKRYIQEKYA